MAKVGEGASGPSLSHRSGRLPPDATAILSLFDVTSIISILTRLHTDKFTLPATLRHGHHISFTNGENEAQGGKAVAQVKEWQRWTSSP